MAWIETEGTFRGPIVEDKFDKTSNGNPQYVARLRATEQWDEAGGEWVECEEQEITAFLVLMSPKGRIFHFQNLMDAIGWDGASFSTLAGHEGTVVQFDVLENEWPIGSGKTRLQVQVVLPADASPGSGGGGGGLKAGLDEEGAKAMDGEWGEYLMQPVAQAPARKKKVVAKKKVSKKAPSPSTPPNTVTKNSAWDMVYTTGSELGHEDDTIVEAFKESMESIGDNEAEFTSEDWVTVRQLALDTLKVETEVA